VKYKLELNESTKSALFALFPGPLSHFEKCYDEAKTRIETGIVEHPSNIYEIQHSIRQRYDLMSAKARKAGK
jgi:hypothetical protein